MKKIIIYIVTTLLFLSWCTTLVGAVSSPIDLGTIDYQDFDYITISTVDHEVDLVFVSSEMNESDLLVEKIVFYPESNETKYRFTSNPVSPSFWFVPGVKSFLYQDDMDGQLYSVSVDYMGVVVPSDPWMVDYLVLSDAYDLLSLNYGNLSGEYSILNSSYCNLTDGITSILVGYENMSGNFSIVNLVDELLANYSEQLMLKQQELNQTINNLENKNGQYDILVNRFSEKTEQFNQLLSKQSELLLAYSELNETYNTTYNSLLNYSLQASHYQKFYDNMISSQNNFMFDDFYYTTPYGYEQKINDLQGQVDMIPLIAVLFIVITGIICWLVFRLVISQKRPTPLELETEVGYEPDANAVDRFVLGVKNLLPKKDIGDNGGGTPTTVTPVPAETTTPSSSSPPDYQVIIDAMDNKMTTMKHELQKDVYDRIDQLIKEKIGA